MSSLAPIVLFTYKRLDTLQQTVNALAANYLADESDLIIYSDGGKNSEDQLIIETTRAFLKTITGFKTISIYESTVNKGLATSIIDGVTEVTNKCGKAIILEDDLVTSKNFLVFMNNALAFYQDNPKILSISGYSPIINGIDPTDVYYTFRSSSWGWATWANRWNKIDWSCSYYFSSFRNDWMAKMRFNHMGSDMSLMIKRQMQNKIDSWAIRFSFHQFEYKLFSVHPAISKVENIGLSEKDATNTVQKYNRFKSSFDTTELSVFNFNNDVQLNSLIIKQFTRNNSIRARILNKIFNVFK